MIAVRPPEYWPRLSYFALMECVDCFVLADTFQYSRQSYQNRTRLRSPQGSQWLSVPLKGGQHGKPVIEVRIEEGNIWRRKHWRALEYNYRSTPFFELYEPELFPLFDRSWENLAALTCATVECIHTLLGFSARLVRASALPEAPSSLVEVMMQAGEDRLMSPEAAAAHDVMAGSAVEVFRYEAPHYRQNFEGFVPEMSVLDLLFNYGSETRALLRQGIGVAGL